MTPPAAQPGHLDPATLAEMLRATVNALPVQPDATAEHIAVQRQAALMAVTSLRPRDPMEAMLAARIVSAHHAAMECFRRAAQHDVTDNVALRLRGRAISLMNLATRMLRELRQCQVAPPAHAMPAQQQATTAPRQAAPASRAQSSAAPAHDPRDPRVSAGSASRPAALPHHPAIAVPARQADALQTRIIDDVIANGRAAAAAAIALAA